MVVPVRYIRQLHHGLLRASSHRSFASLQQYSTVDACPSPTCACREMPSGLDIDYNRALSGSVAPYHEHILLHTQANDWPSKIEDDKRYPLAKAIKNSQRQALIASVKPGQTPRNILITSVAFLNAPSSHLTDQVVSLVKLGVQFPLRPADSRTLLDTVTEESLGKAALQSLQSKLNFTAEPVSAVTILICGHDSRDSRCGIMGPLLQAEFQTQLASKNISLSAAFTDAALTARLGLTSHIGGHAFAGNVIINIPKSLHFTSSPLAGRAVWYGRVEPRHIQGIIDKTIIKGCVINELCRGVV